jgi:hypothetical protein
MLHEEACSFSVRENAVDTGLRETNHPSIGRAILLPAESSILLFCGIGLLGCSSRHEDRECATLIRLQLLSQVLYMVDAQPMSYVWKR